MSAGGEATLFPMTLTGFLPFSSHRVLWSLTLLLSCIVPVAVHIARRRRIAELISKIPGPTAAHPILGNLDVLYELKKYRHLLAPHIPRHVRQERATKKSAKEGRHAEPRAGIRRFQKKRTAALTSSRIPAVSRFRRQPPSCLRVIRMTVGQPHGIRSRGEEKQEAAPRETLLRGEERQHKQ
ncbi:hypothetical protein MRX96_042352 [Rhipicephalus microplus]|uniref:Uncharacterized protein n=1 Tax=Rhipicephalus microplus TaxID=6941 RepID=A0A9J6EHU3_RHIMP|nr:hypothetical protein HPB51_017348 [Rhipicephalus microplus]